MIQLPFAKHSHRSMKFQVLPNGRNNERRVDILWELSFNFNQATLNPKRAGGRAESAPLDICCRTSAICYFLALKLPSSLALDLRPFLRKSDIGL